VAQAPDVAAWPTKPIKAYIPFGAGSATDVVPRAVFDGLAAELGQPIVIENRGGAGGTLGVGAVVRAEPDGYTILANSSAHAIAPWIVPNIPYDTAKDLSGALMIGQNANVLIVSPAKGWKSVQDFVAYAKAHPGTVNYGSAGVGTATHLSAERFRLSAGFEAVHVPFKGAPEALREILGDRIDFYFSPILSAVPLIQSGQVRGLAVSSLARSDTLPDIPTTIEAGYPDSDYVFWVGLFAPAATPRNIINRLHDAAAAALADKAVAENLKALGAAPMAMTPTEFDGYIKGEIATIAKVVKAAGIQPN